MEAQIHDIKADITEINQSVRLLINFMNQAEGGKKLLFGLMTLSAGLGSGITYFVKGWLGVAP
jgi:hypothetical protein